MALMVGYARVSTVLQDVETQRAALLELGVPEKRIYTDTGSSGKTMTRAGLEQALAAVSSFHRSHVPHFASGRVPSGGAKQAAR